MRDKFLMLTSGAGIASVELVNQLPIDQIEGIGKLLIQLAIGLVTLWKMVKKPKPKNN